VTTNANPPVLVEKFEDAAGTVVGGVEGHLLITPPSRTRTSIGPEKVPKITQGPCSIQRANLTLRTRRLHHSWYTPRPPSTIVKSTARIYRTHALTFPPVHLGEPRGVNVRAGGGIRTVRGRLLDTVG
jgi:hypothetical protein